jgi:hypothetical protein
MKLLMTYEECKVELRKIETCFKAGTISYTEALIWTLQIAESFCDSEIPYTQFQGYLTSHRYELMRQERKAQYPSQH